MKTRIIRFNKAVTTRRRIDQYLSANRLAGLTLDVGGRRGGHYRECYSEAVVVDIDRTVPIDVQADAHMLPFRADAFDSILCMEVIEHMDRPGQGVDEMRRVLRCGGRLLLTTRFLFPIHDAPGDFFRFTRFGLGRLLRKWRVEEILETDTSIETLDIVLNRFAFDKGLHACFRSAILGLSLLMLPIARVLSRVVRTNAVATGYIVSARKPE
ncbi:MAG: methyltransferase domain-containing protein [Planctomycetes bacterium]|nr:methyltransferase domain-containing protein [Planctomycetota bacterium]